MILSRLSSMTTISAFYSTACVTARRMTTLSHPAFVMSSTSSNTNPIVSTQRQSFIRRYSSTPPGNGHSATNYGEGMDQETLMESDYIIPVDRHDNPLLSTPISKRQAHEFNPSQPRGILHRAFSVFLFNSRNELLLTQRAPSKITFPNVWTNTCCSHPLTDMATNEVDTNDNFPEFNGIKTAAIRKLRHELGIQVEDIPLNGFRFLTRFHYWAADTVTYGTGVECPWGEHEIDYVLFVRYDDEQNGPLKLNLNEEEVSDHEYVSLQRLKECIYDPDKALRMHHDTNSNEHTNTKMLFSPWFKGIMEHGGFEWMDNLEEALVPGSGSKYCTRDIMYIDPPREHWAVYNLESHTRDTGILVEEPQKQKQTQTHTQPVLR